MPALDLSAPAQLPIIKSTTLVAGEVRRVLLPPELELSKLDVKVYGSGVFNVAYESVPADGAVIGATETWPMAASTPITLEKFGTNTRTRKAAVTVLGLYAAAATPTVRVMLSERRS